MKPCYTKEELDEEERRIRAYEDQGMTRSDAQGIVMAEDMMKARMKASKNWCRHYEYLPYIESDLLEKCKYCK